MFHLQGICRKSTQECPYAHSVEEMELSRSRGKKKALPTRADSASSSSESSSSPAPLREAVQATTAAKRNQGPVQLAIATARVATNATDDGVVTIVGSTRRGDHRPLDLSPELELTPEQGMYYSAPLQKLPSNRPARGLSPKEPPAELAASDYPRKLPLSTVGTGLARPGMGWPGPPPGLEDLDVDFPGFQPSGLSALVQMPAMVPAALTGLRYAQQDGTGLWARGCQDWPLWQPREASLAAWTSCGLQPPLRQANHRRGLA